MGLEPSEENGCSPAGGSLGQGTRADYATTIRQCETNLRTS